MLYSLNVIIGIESRFPGFDEDYTILVYDPRKRDSQKM